MKKKVINLNFALMLLIQFTYSRYTFLCICYILHRNARVGITQNDRVYQIIRAAVFVNSLHIYKGCRLHLVIISSNMFVDRFGLALATVTLLGCSVEAREFQIWNKLPGEIWVGCQGNPGHAHLNNGGWKLGAGQRMSVHSADNWAGRFWARSWCNPGNNHCETGDCGNKVECNGAGGAPPASLAEITLKGWGDLDYYDISLVDGYNVPVAMEPLGGQGDGGQYSCKRSQCTADILRECPGELQQHGSGGVIACRSACEAFQTDQYCCRGAHDRPETCRSSDWPKDYPKFFKDRCPDAYSYAYDDHKSTFTCKAPAYLITFGV